MSMPSATEGALHPAEIELRHYVRGTLAAGHAVAILAHCVVCEACGARLEATLARTGVASPGAQLPDRSALEGS